MTTERKDIIWDFQRTIQEVYKEHELNSLKGHDDDFMVNGRQILVWYSEVVRKGKGKYYKDFDFNKNFDDLIFCSDEIMYFLANMYLYRDYINNPIQDGFQFGEDMVYPNYQNLEAKRYSMFTGIVSEKLYNYWDRIGDLLATYFPDLIKSHQVYFAKIIDVIPEDFRDNDDYKWLKNFKENEFIELNKKRKQHVHYTTEDTEFKYNHLGKSSDKKHIETIIKDREDMADFYKQHIDLTLDGFEKTLLLIERITEKTLEDVE